MSDIAAHRAQIREIFFPFTAKKIDEVKNNDQRLVHYTTADVAMNIIRSREIWMRNSTTMNDYMEIEHGFQCLSHAYQTSPGQKFKQSLDSIFPGAATEVEQRFNAWLPGIRRDTYLTCFSEHRNDEDSYGRLSMWRAYGGTTGVALVLKTDVFFNETNPLKAYSSPVGYFDAESFSSEFLRVSDAIASHASFVETLGRETVFRLAFNMLRFAVLCTKHPGFREECEWRVIHSPTMDQSDRLIPSIESVRGTPQRILKIPLKNIPEEDFVGLEISELLDRIIIGPSQYPQAIYQAFTQLLHDAGVQNPGNKVLISDIPLR